MFGWTNLCEDEQGRVWIASEEGLLFYIAGMDRIQKHQFQHNSIDNGHITSLAYQTPYLYLGTLGNGLFRIDCSTDQLVNMTEEATNLLPRTDINKLYFDKKGHLWIGSNSGLFIYDAQTNNFLPYKEDTGGGQWLDGINAKDIIQHPNQNFYISTYGDGLIAYNPETKQWNNYRSKHYRLNFMNEVIIPTTSKLLINTPGCILEFDPNFIGHTHPEFRNFRTSTGIDRSLIAFPDGRVWTGGKRGVQELQIPTLETTHSPIALYIKKLSIEGIEPFTNKTLNQLETLELNYNENTLSLEPGAINLALLPSTYLYQKIEGIDKDWVEISPDQTITYSNIPPGQYTYFYKASDQTGRWTKEIGSLPIIIHPPWWRSNWAYFAYTCMFIGALAFARRQIIQREKLKSELRLEQVEREKVQEIDQLRARFFANISHEFRTPTYLDKSPVGRFANQQKASGRAAPIFPDA